MSHQKERVNQENGRVGILEIEGCGRHSQDVGGVSGHQLYSTSSADMSKLKQRQEISEGRSALHVKRHRTDRLSVFWSYEKLN